ncbi:unnamed protein product [Notodromas monacha]|uniref:Mitochondrial enolase superfamily member 1 n=1 Tax=Notodromas monacha TaxID=399045 RepID=A0A7R9BYG1_9CRUS|nr:unnamed protein product [Notodromas monacha]CAG0922982.1 unnamed protein product [Notodromas monacha]
MRIRGISVRDIRFPTSLRLDGSDAQHVDPDYSCAYVVLFTDSEAKGFGLSFTIGRGTEIGKLFIAPLVQAIRSLAHLVVGQDFEAIVKDFGAFSRRLTNDSQLRWLGPEKGVLHLAASAVVNAVWDLWGRTQNKPIWKLLTDLTPEELVSCVDFTYLEDALTKEEALEILRSMVPGKDKREEEIRSSGYPCYTTSSGWIGYDEDKIRNNLLISMQAGFSKFKIKVGQDLEKDKKRLRLVRSIIGDNRQLMIDANQVWEVDQAINWVKELAEFKPVWIEEPTSPDDILGHAKVAQALKDTGIGVATGEHCHNRVMFKQLFKSGGMQYCQIDACRVGGINENIAVMLMAKKFGVPVCPHAGGIGLCEMIQHLAIFNFICISGDLKHSVAEYADHLHEHFIQPARIKHGCYIVPDVSDMMRILNNLRNFAPGYSVEMIGSSLINYEYPLGPKWREMFDKKLYEDPSKQVPPYVEHRPETRSSHFQRFHSIQTS